MHSSKKLTIHDKVLLYDGEKCKLVELGDVRFFETYGNYSKTYFIGGAMLINRTLNYLENRLPEGAFFRANRQFIVNLSHVANVTILENSSFCMELACGKKIEVSRRRSQQFKDALAL